MRTYKQYIFEHYKRGEMFGSEQSVSEEMPEIILQYHEGGW